MPWRRSFTFFSAFPRSTGSFFVTALIAALGMLGTTISSSEEREEKTSVVQADEADFDTVAGMIWSNLLAYTMIVTGAVLLCSTHADIREVRTPAETLHPAAGGYAFALFSLGIVAAGFLAIPILAGSTAAYAVADTFGWREGMDNRVSDAKGFYLVFVGAIFVGAGIKLAKDINIVDALYYSQVLDGMLIPVLILIAWTISNNPKIMGTYLASRFENTFAVLAFLVTVALSGLMIWQ